MKKIINEVAGTVTFTFDGLESIVFDPRNASLENRNYAMLHGFAARLGDNAAITKDASNNFTVTELMRKEAILELLNHYESDSTEWSPKAKAKVAPQNATILAIAAKRKCTYAEAEAWVAEKMLAELA
jgi:hypothetical protein